MMIMKKWIRSIIANGTDNHGLGPGVRNLDIPVVQENQQVSSKEDRFRFIKMTAFLISVLVIFSSFIGYASAEHDSNPPYAGRSPAYDVPESIPVRPYDRYTLFRLSAVEGQARIIRLYEETTEAVVNEVLGSGDTVETGPGGRVELSLGNGIFVRLDENSTLEVVQLDPENRDYPVFLRLLQGQIFVDTQGTRQFGSNPVVEVRVDTPDGVMWVDPESLVRIMRWDETGTDLVVYHGRAVVTSQDGQITVFPGQGILGLKIDYLPSPQTLPVYTGDAFEAWNQHRRSLLSGSYLNDEFGRQYFDDGTDLYRYGTWRHHPEYGRVWVPPVGDDWFPYYNGHWSWVNGVLVWVPYEPWGWVTHHYGLWYFDPVYHWIWIPRPHFGFAWVAWIRTGSYLGWCPLTVGYQPLSFARIHFSTRFGFFSFTYIDTYYRPWIFVDYHRFHVHRHVTNIIIHNVHIDRHALTRVPIIRDVRQLDIVRRVVPVERIRRKGYDFAPGERVLVRPRVKPVARTDRWSHGSVDRAGERRLHPKPLPNSMPRTDRPSMDRRPLKPKPITRPDGSSKGKLPGQGLSSGDRKLYPRPSSTPRYQLQKPDDKRDDGRNRLPWARTVEPKPLQDQKRQEQPDRKTYNRPSTSPGVRDFMNRLYERQTQNGINRKEDRSVYTRPSELRPDRYKLSPSLPRVYPGSQPNRSDRAVRPDRATRSTPSFSRSGEKRGSRSIIRKPSSNIKPRSSNHTVNSRSRSSTPSKSSRRSKPVRREKPDRHNER